MTENWNCVVFKTMLFRVWLQSLNLYSLVLTLGSEWDNIYWCILRSESSDSPALWKLCSSVELRNWSKNKPYVRTASRSCRNHWEGNFNQSWTQEVAWSRDNPLSLLIYRPWCLVSCKSDLFQIPSRGFSLLSQCLRYAFEALFGKMANAPGQLTQ